MKPLGIAMLFLILGIVAGCKSPGCLVHEKIVDSLSQGVSNTLECDNFAAVREDVDKAIGLFGMCKGGSVPTGPIAESFCPIAAESVVEFIYQHGLPERYGCKATKARAFLKSVLTEQCKKLPVSGS